MKTTPKYRPDEFALTPDGRAYGSFSEAERAARRRFGSHGKGQIWLLAKPPMRHWGGAEPGALLGTIRQDNTGMWTELTWVGCKYA